MAAFRIVDGGAIFQGFSVGLQESAEIIEKKKLVCSLIAFLIILGSALPLPSAVVEASPATEIRDWYDLHAIRDNPDGSYLLMNDLDAAAAGYEELASEAANEGEGWEPIGIYEQGVAFDPFVGTFDGQGYEIRDFVIDRREVVGVGLFGAVVGSEEGGSIRNVGVANAYVTGSIGVGGLVGLNAGNVTNSYCTGNVTGSSRVGGLVGFNIALVSNCYSSGNVTGDDILVGGLVGYNTGIVSNSYSGASVSGDGGVGGLVGGNQGTVRNSYASGSVTGGWHSIGGLVGHSWEGTVSNCYASGSVSGDARVGGLVGHNDYYATVARSYATGSVTGDSLVGGLVGYNRGTVSDTYASGGVSGNSSVGGLVGDNEAVVENSFWDMEASGIDTSDGGLGKTTAQMMNIATFKDTRTEGLDTPWDITAVAHGETDDAYAWNIVRGESYPFLSGKQFVMYGLTITSSGGGSVTVPGEGAHTYLGGTVVDLVVEAEALHRFVNWSGDVDTIARVTSGRTTITMDGDYSITANFEEIRPTVNWPLIGLIIAAVLVVGLYVYAPLQRKIKQIRRGNSGG
ncbi:MAG: GLUG motif-containing protein [Dehalococcoidia bacterium]